MSLDHFGIGRILMCFEHSKLDLDAMSFNQEKPWRSNYGGDACALSVPSTLSIAWKPPVPRHSWFGVGLSSCFPRVPFFFYGHKWYVKSCWMIFPLLVFLNPCTRLKTDWYTDEIEIEFKCKNNVNPPWTKTAVNISRFLIYIIYNNSFFEPRTKPITHGKPKTTSTTIYDQCKTIQHITNTTYIYIVEKPWKTPWFQEKSSTKLSLQILGFLPIYGKNLLEG